MRVLSIRCFVILSGIAGMASCSRPVAHFQPTARENFATQSPSSVTLRQQPLIESGNKLVLPTECESIPVEPTAQAKQVVGQLEAYVRNDTKLVSNRKLVKRLARINEVLDAKAKPSLGSSPVTAKKTTFMERTMLKKIDKKIKQHLAPDQHKSRSSNILIGVIIALVGLLLIIIASGFFNVVGIIALVLGIALIVFTYLKA